MASAGSRFRLSVRLLMLEVTAGLVEVDFTGVDEVTEEFLDELFLVWAPAHALTTVRPVHLPARLAPVFFDFAKRARSQLDLLREDEPSARLAS